MSLLRAIALVGCTLVLGCDSEPSAGIDPAECGACDSLTDLGSGSIAAVFRDGYALDVGLTMPEGSAPAYQVSWELVVREGGSELSREAASATVVAASEAHARSTLYADFFFDLGAADDDTHALRTLSVVARIAPCADAQCDETLPATSETERPVSFLARPYPDAELRDWGRDNDLGELDAEALGELSDSIAAAGCQNLLIAANGTLFEGTAGANAAWHFMRGRQYDCLVSVAYNDSTGGSGGFTDGDTLMLCESAELGLDALDQVWQAAVELTGVAHWDVFGHSKGAAAAVKAYQRRWHDMSAWPNARIYTVGLPWRMAAQYLPTPTDYEPGRIYSHDQIVAFTWANDAVRHIDRCTDLDALFIDGAGDHDYTPMFSKAAAEDATQRANRDDFMSGTQTWVGDRYE